MPRASKQVKPSSPRQFSISSFLPKVAPAGSAAPSERVKSHGKDQPPGRSDVLSDEEGEQSAGEFKVPTVPAKHRDKGKGKAVAVLDLTEDDEDVEPPSSSPPPPVKGKRAVANGKKASSKNGKGKAVSRGQDEERSDVGGNPDAMWVDRFAPSSRDDLALHVRKLAAVESWLQEAFALGDRPKHLAKYRRVLVLSGPAGSGKTATLRILAREMGVEIIEWREGTSVQLAEEERPESLMHRFASFLTRAGMAPALEFGPDPSDPSSSSSASASSSSATVSTAQDSLSARRLLLIEDLPNVSHYPTKLALRSALAQYLASPRVAAPLVLIVSEALARPGDDEGGGAGWLNGNGYRGESVDARSVCGVEVLEHPACREIAFNPVAPTIMRKALSRILDRVYSLSRPIQGATHVHLAPRPTQAVLDVLVAHSGGDLRSALMSLQFLLTEGGGGTGDMGGSDPLAQSKSKGKKRKRKGAVSDEDEEAEHAVKGRAGKDGKAGIKKLLQVVTARESSLFIFHALGKVLYNKRWGDSAEDDKKDQDRAGIAQEKTSDQLPRHLRDRWDRRPSKVDPDVLFAEAPLDADIFLSYLHHNYPPFTNEIDQCSGIVDALSAADAVMSAASENEEAYRHRPLTSLYGFHLGVRSTLLFLPSPVARRKQVLRKSELWETLRLARQNEEGVEEVLHAHTRQAGGENGAMLLGGAQKSVVLTEVIPWLSLITPPDASTFLVSLASFPPLSTAAQSLVTGDAIGEKDASSLQEEGLDTGPAVDMSEPRRGHSGGRVLEEVDEDLEEDLPPTAAIDGAAPTGEQSLFDPDDDIVD